MVEGDGRFLAACGVVSRESLDGRVGEEEGGWEPFWNVEGERERHLALFC